MRALTSWPLRPVVSINLVHQHHQRSCGHHHDADDGANRRRAFWAGPDNCHRDGPEHREHDARCGASEEVPGSDSRRLVSPYAAARLARQRLPPDLVRTSPLLDSTEGEGRFRLRPRAELIGHGANRLRHGPATRLVLNRPGSQRRWAGPCSAGQFRGTQVKGPRFEGPSRGAYGPVSGRSGDVHLLVGLTGGAGGVEVTPLLPRSRRTREPRRRRSFTPEFKAEVVAAGPPARPHPSAVWPGTWTPTRVQQVINFLRLPAPAAPPGPPPPAVSQAPGRHGSPGAFTLPL